VGKRIEYNTDALFQAKKKLAEESPNHDVSRQLAYVPVSKQGSCFGLKYHKT
jgi:hypothetical protein